MKLLRGIKTREISSRKLGAKVNSYLEKKITINNTFLKANRHHKQQNPEN